MYSATGERSNVIQQHTLKTNASSFQKDQPVNKPFTYHDILKQDQILGLHIKKNVKYLCHIKGMPMTTTLRGAQEYGITISAETLVNLGNNNQKFASTYIRLLEIALQLVLGYHFNQFDLVFKEYYTERDPLPAILPPGERDTFTNRTKKG